MWILLFGRLFGIGRSDSRLFSIVPFYYCSQTYCFGRSLSGGSERGKYWVMAVSIQKSVWDEPVEKSNKLVSPSRTGDMLWRPLLAGLALGALLGGVALAVVVVFFVEGNSPYIIRSITLYCWSIVFRLTEDVNDTNNNHRDNENQHRWVRFVDTSVLRATRLTRP